MLGGIDVVESMRVVVASLAKGDVGVVAGRPPAP